MTNHLKKLCLCWLLLALQGLAQSSMGQGNTNPSWTSIGPRVPTYSVAVAPSNPNAVYVGGAGNVLKSNDGGTTWQSVPLGGDATTALAIDRTNSNIVYAGIAFTSYCHHSFRRLFKSINGGASWSDSSPPINGCDNINALVLQPSNPNTVYVANFDDFGDSWTPLIKSVDAGATWDALYGTPFAALAIDPLHPNTIYGGTFDFTYFGYDGFDFRNGVLKSNDGGMTWNTTNLTGAGVEALVVDPVNSNTLYAVTRGFYSDPRGFRGVFKSIDGGVNWSSINNGLTHLFGTNPNVRWPTTLTRASLVVHPGVTTTLYAGFPGSGIFKSIDGGATWAPFNSGLTNLDVRALAVVPGNPSALYAATAGGVFKISDNTPITTNAIDDAQFYVRQHYLDFLNREPDQAGWDYWANQIAQCVSDARCIHERRIGVSAAFFIEQEFQQTGYVVYRFHRAAYGTMLNSPTRANLTFTQFMADRAQFEAGPALQQSVSAFAESFVTRPEFKEAYPESMSPTIFVNKLFDTASLIPFTQERDNAINALTNGSKTRAQVLLDLIEIQQFKDREYNRAFVLMQYFGYLRRDPEQAGSDFWLNILNNAEPNNYRAMVCAFITSAEYQLRFGSAVTRSNQDCGQSP
jgi:hypothetical protein